MELGHKLRTLLTEEGHRTNGSLECGKLSQLQPYESTTKSYHQTTILCFFSHLDSLRIAITSILNTRIKQASDHRYQVERNQGQQNRGKQQFVRAKAQRQKYLPSHPFLSKMPATTAETLSLVTHTVSVAPLVLLSAADHFGRQAKGSRARVVGVLLGQNTGKNVRVSNSFAGQLGLRSDELADVLR